jgi:ADP-heptose:LPS heptosyltransferase
MTALNCNRPMSIERLVIVRNDRLGDLVVSLPAIAAARRAWPTAQLAVVCRPAFKPLLEHQGLCDEVLVDSSASNRSRPDSRSLEEILRPFQADAGIALWTTWRNLRAMKDARIPLRIGYGGKLAGMLLATHRIWTSRRRPPVHESDFASMLVQRLWRGSRQEGRIPSPIRAALAIAPTWRLQAETIVGRLDPAAPCFAIHPGNGGSSWNWPPDAYRQLAMRLSRYGKVLVTAGQGEERLAAMVASGAGSNGQISCGAPPEILAAILDQSAALVTSSTGPAHLAAATGVPTVALFSRQQSQIPERWAPIGQRVHVIQPPGDGVLRRRYSTAFGFAHMNQISIDDVLQQTLANAVLPAARRAAAVQTKGSSTLLADAA